jgi:hypothetical protein
MKAWSCSFVQQPASNVCFTGIKQETFVSDLPLYVYRKTEGNKIVNAGKGLRRFTTLRMRESTDFPLTWL